MPFVVDASTTLSWCLPDEQSEYEEAILQRLSRDHGIVPSVWFLEVANGLVVAERRGRITAAFTAATVADLLALSITADPARVESLPTIVELARAHALSTYDAAYLELAMREGLPLATQDDALRAACERLGVPLA